MMSDLWNVNASMLFADCMHDTAEVAKLLPSAFSDPHTTNCATSLGERDRDTGRGGILL
jgi:hypothetical protein